MIPDELIKVNKSLSRLRYEYEEYNSEEVQQILDLLQYHLFLVITFFNKGEFNARQLREKLIEKLAEGL
jgi:hypothetical protein